MARAVEFPSYDGRFTLRGWVYIPDDTPGPVPAVIASGGFADSVERMVPTAEALAQAGLGVLIYEHRNTGISDGEPRLEIDPVAQVRDMGMAITFAQTLPEFDRNRIGLFGTSFSGGHVLAVAADDKRVKAVVASNPWIAGHDVALTMGGAKALAQFQELISGERGKILAGQPGAVVALGMREDDPSQDFALFRDDDAMNYFEHGPTGLPASWKNAFTLRSLEYMVGYDVRPFAKRISPTPLLMLVALDDHTMPASLGLEFYAAALQPKELVTFKGGHYDAYLPDRAFPVVMDASKRWFEAHL